MSVLPSFVAMKSMYMPMASCCDPSEHINLQQLRNITQHSLCDNTSVLIYIYMYVYFFLSAGEARKKSEFPFGQRYIFSKIPFGQI